MYIWRPVELQLRWRQRPLKILEGARRFSCAVGSGPSGNLSTCSEGVLDRR